jgi:hypothetical protein
METGIDEMHDELFINFKKLETEGRPGKVKIEDAEKAMMNCKNLNLTPF